MALSFYIFSEPYVITKEFLQIKTQHDVTWNDAFYVADMAASILFKILHHKLRGSKEAVLSPHFSSSSGSLFLLLRHSFPPPCTNICKRPAALLGGGNLSLKRRKSESKEEVKWAQKGGKARTMKGRCKVRGQKCLFATSLFTVMNLWYEMHLFMSYHIHGAYSLYQRLD